MSQPGFCVSCGAILAEGALKCPDCGAPVNRVVRKSGRAAVAGFFLVVLFALSLFQSLYVIIDPDTPLEQAPSLSTTTFEIAGSVRFQNGSAASGVNVSVVGHEGLHNVTDVGGHYALGGVPAGYVQLSFGRGNESVLRIRVFLTQAETIDAALPPARTAVTEVEHGSFQTLKVVTRACGALLLAGGLLTALGAVACYRRRNWGLAMAGAIAGLFASLPLSLLVGGIAIVLVVKGRPEFENQTSPARPH